METKPAATYNRYYEDFDPVSKWRVEEARDTVELYLPGFKREQIRIQINHLGFMVISGERPVDGTKWRRFKKEIELPMHCNADAIHGNFMQNILTVVLPKKIRPPAVHQEEEQQEQEQEQEIRQIPEFEPETKKKEKGKKKVTYDDENTEFGGERGTEEMTETRAKGALTEDTNDTTRHQLVENDEVLTPETTREVALKFMLVIIVILVIASYLVDMSKSLVAHAHSYFHN